MEKINLYAVLDKESDTISNLFLASSDVEAGSFMVRNFKAIEPDVPAQLKNDYLERIRHSCVVKIGDVDVEKKEVLNNYNVICDFFDFDFGDEYGKEKI